MLNPDDDIRDAFADQFEVNPFDCTLRVTRREQGNPVRVIFTFPNGKPHIFVRTTYMVANNIIRYNWSVE